MQGTVTEGLQGRSIEEDVEAAIKEAKDRVSKIERVIEGSNEGKERLSIETLEGLDLNIDVTTQGYTVVNQMQGGQTFESLHSLLCEISSGYRDGFAGSLFSALQGLQGGRFGGGNDSDQDNS
mmetsp:Transcript_49209/g.76832  ORF Transcript_49209/g.76832 Transcript_49209/m.76832 type:complete len:123 (-) Transcript_49209:882-1250(-)|eukprot:CAMPEP_0184295968 /NCGR_PEP_ID=MMETSP1049-20130417/6920_1 /TAXON_ID=77928 /ORGANISM="Proteomonas sulcata, Strain CCMP704" /LENGTH=122 /DNA_ID=CAMNT_0026604893 /DNA_START=425 /DNA_END=796 /DNA_ORIENTATION=-